MLDAETLEERRLFVEGEGFWIMDPPGHRRYAAGQGPRDGEIVGTMFGPMPVIRVDPPVEDDWVCDFCNDTVPVVLYLPSGGGIWPVASYNSYALCNVCAANILVDFELEFWPMHACACPSCVAAMDELARTVPGWLVAEVRSRQAVLR